MEVSYTDRWKINAILSRSFENIGVQRQNIPIDHVSAPLLPRGP